MDRRALANAAMWGCGQLLTVRLEYGWDAADIERLAESFPAARRIAEALTAQVEAERQARAE